MTFVNPFDDFTRVKSRRSKSFGGTDKWQRKGGVDARAARWFLSIVALAVMTLAPLEDEKVRAIYSVRKSTLDAMDTLTSGARHFWIECIKYVI